MRLKTNELSLEAFLARIADLSDATHMPNRKGLHENYEVVFPKFSNTAFTSFSLFTKSLLREEQSSMLEQERGWRWHASRRPEIYGATTTSLEHAPRVNYFPLGGRCFPILRRYIYIHIYSEKSLTVFASRSEGTTYDKCHERSAIAHLNEIRACCYPILSFNPLN